MEDRLLPLSNDVESEPSPDIDDDNNVTKNSVSNISNSIDSFNRHNPSGISEHTITTCDSDLVSKISSDPNSTNEIMPEVI